MSEPIRVLIADDQALLRASFRALIDNEPGMTVVGEAATGQEAVDLAVAKLPDVVLMDVRMPEMDGIEATRQICAAEATKGTRVLILTMFDLDAHVYEALRAGAVGFLLKDTQPAELCHGIHVVARGEALLGPSITRRLIAEFARQPEQPPSLARELRVLTDREREVLTLIARGLSNTELAERLRLSLATVKTYVGRLLAKLHARDRAQLVIIAYESGLLGR
ncbi:response regulator [Actinocrispum wychmicini]|uniref:DNA-binding NarL/FixJ family response regulator n=1 Tax=Actinocrispum wychmicini TaxID=1213861 RepID=A0A4V2S7G4_9PSEU|nr:response regulator transcription factor [Actinocrispum wychmicini]TCO59800.1 DNA-binding NarL/FixJ family response regulator [Actinocrispum wychmicini]